MPLKRKIITGDIHGCIRTLKTLLENKVKIHPEDELYFLGDYIDRGPSSREVLDYLIDLKWSGYKVHALRGNHEELFLQAIGDEDYMQAWYNNGAVETLKSFDVSEEKLYDYDSIRKIPERYKQFLLNMVHYIEEEDFILCHAGLNLTLNDPFSDKDSMLWIRDFEYDGSKINQKRIVHGHTPMPLVNLEQSLRNKNSKIINLDAGCVYKDLPGYGNLLAMDIVSGAYFFQSNIDN